VILSPPGQRQDISATMTGIKNIFIKVDKIDYANFKNGSNIHKPEEIRERRADNTLSQLKQDDELKKRKYQPINNS
jgi:hypothetical protein